jgi:hypothetical protein
MANRPAIMPPLPSYRRNLLHSPARKTRNAMAVRKPSNSAIWWPARSSVSARAMRSTELPDAGVLGVKKLATTSTMKISPVIAVMRSYLATRSPSST